MNNAIISYPVHMDGNYKEKPKTGLRRAFMGTYLFYFTPAYFKTRYKTKPEVMKGLEDAGLGSEKMEEVNVVYFGGNCGGFEREGAIGSAISVKKWHRKK